MENYKEIIVPTDGSKNAKLAFIRALKLSQDHDNKVAIHLFYIVDTNYINNFSSIDDSVVDKITDDAKKILDQYLKDAKKQKITNIDYAIKYGAPKEIIAQELPKLYQNPLIIIGATGLNPIEKLLIGSTTAYVSKNASCDVLIVKK
ncbi:universal stress protein UspA [Philodulcilactobacillus myokoensis]|uniref:Universal stress protein UspA n=1 Tax=Philodulcilactobacillus myokoensis TaxID=2929573 RepID=A0A9W6B1A0_9LACO|nr:universal stress protein [Philodulcilactobacillus myokoensis]GLB46650.1 universal stress protein UspA [Philodulcilactobacillus myokoensis]